jgi:hypothetical protein
VTRLLARAAVLAAAGTLALAAPAAAEQKGPTRGALQDSNYYCAKNADRGSHVCVRGGANGPVSVYECPTAAGPCNHVDGPPMRRAPAGQVTAPKGGALAPPR